MSVSARSSAVPRSILSACHARLLPSSPPRRRELEQRCACLAIRTAATTARQHAQAAPQIKYKQLPPAQPAWSWNDDDLRDGIRNARQRRAALNTEDQDRLVELKQRLVDVNQRLAAARDAQKSSSQRTKADQVDGLSDQSSTATATQKEAKADYQRLLKEQEAVTAEARMLRLKLPNRTAAHVLEQLGVAGDGDLDVEVSPKAFRYGGDIASVPGPDLHGAGKAMPEYDHVNLLHQHSPGSLLHPSALPQQVAASGFPHLGSHLAILSHAIERLSLSIAIAEGARLRVVPDVIPTELLERSGFAPRQADAAQIYTLAAAGEALPLALAATAELPLLGLHAARQYSTKQLPIFEVASGHAFRAEAGSRGKATRGLFRVHQFSKAELFVVCTPDHSEAWLDRLLAVQLRVLDALQLTWRALHMPPHELGASAYQKIDVEVYMRGRGDWGEVCSASNCTDYQARRLSIKYKSAAADASSPEYAHTLNATAAAIPRLLVALVEQHGFRDGKMLLPSALKEHWLGDQDEVHWLADAETTSASGVANRSVDAPQSVPGSVRTFSTKVPQKGTASPPPPPPSSSSPSSPSSPSQPASSILARSIARVREAAARSGTDPGSMVISFLILHELSAIIPLLIIFWILAFFGAGKTVLDWLLPANAVEASVVEDAGPASNGIRDRLRAWVDDGTRWAEKIGRKKGWFGFEKGSEATGEGVDGAILVGGFANAVAAYAVVKAIVPLRIAACIWLAGPFARLTIEPLKRLGRQLGTKAGSRR
ncbi:seryl-tRNA synthetase [Ceraceosorus guamensis]|uniref:serine--tRNA ligase n=1 Tax=Ceraceosorus guamensis TaxID=1522189 RepID=A0A316VTL5_9BASI|nr:seryl-tRNA synthetase [Ceraceosorus guamensis]PWN39783.1 seryl-tRNA synthetase [Ceraceosorus guamensis]